MQAKLLSLLQEYGPRGVNSVKLAYRAGWGIPGGLPMSLNTLHQHIHNLKRHGIAINSKSGTANIYSLVMQTHCDNKALNDRAAIQSHSRDAGRN